MKMLRSFGISISAVAFLGALGCRRAEKNETRAKMISSPGVMVVNEVCSISQGYQTEGQRVTVRGTLNALEVGSYALFNSQWDPFDPEAGKDIPRIAIRFRNGEEPDDQLGWWVDVTGTIATTRQADGRIAVTLEDAVIEYVPEGEGVEMTPREEISQEPGTSDGDKPAN